MVHGPNDPILVGYQPVEFDPRQGYPGAADLVYQCRICRDLLPSVPSSYTECTCGNVYIDVDAGRIVVEEVNSVSLLRRMAPPMA